MELSSWLNDGTLKLSKWWNSQAVQMMELSSWPNDGPYDEFLKLTRWWNPKLTAIRIWSSQYGQGKVTAFQPFMDLITSSKLNSSKIQVSLYCKFGVKLIEFDNCFQLCIWQVKIQTKPAPFKHDTHYTSMWQSWELNFIPLGLKVQLLSHVSVSNMIHTPTIPSRYTAAESWSRHHDPDRWWILNGISYFLDLFQGL